MESFSVPADVTIHLAQSTTVDEGSLEDLSAVLDIAADGDEIEQIEVDLDRLIQVASKHSSLETRYGWRR